MLGDHANAVALTQAADEFLLEPGELKCAPFDLQHFGHVSPDHPTDVNTKLRLVVDRHVASFRVGLQMNHGLPAVSNDLLGAGKHNIRCFGGCQGERMTDASKRESCAAAHGETGRQNGYGGEL